MTGMRVGESTALLWNDLDFDTGIIKVTKSLYYQNVNKFEFTETKAKAGIRNIVLDDNTLSYLLEWTEVKQNNFDNDFILSFTGLPSTKNIIARLISKYSSLAGVHHIKIHALKHSHASLLIRIGENPLIIKERLGHEEIATSLGTYDHLYPRSNFEFATKLKNAVSINPSTVNKL